MVYQPQQPPAKLEELPDYVGRELENVSRSLAEQEEIELRAVSKEPLKPRIGMIVYADGTNWDPGSGAGLYLYTALGWGLIGSSFILPDAITNVLLANMPTNTIKGRITAGTGDPEDLTVSQFTSMIALATASTQGALSAADKAFIDAFLIVSPMEYGALGAGIDTDTDAPAVQAALNAIKASPYGGLLELNRLYDCDNVTLTYTNVSGTAPSFMIAGTNNLKCGLIFRGNNHGLDITMQTWGDFVVVAKNFGVFKRDTNTLGSAIRCRSLDYVGGTGVTGNSQGFIFDGVRIESLPGETGYWRNGIDLYQVPHTIVANCWIQGRGGTTTSKRGGGVNVGSFCMALKVYGSTIRGWKGSIHCDNDDFYNFYPDQTTPVTTRLQNTAYTVGQEFHVYEVTRKYKFVCTVAGTTANVPNTDPSLLDAAATPPYNGYDFGQNGDSPFTVADGTAEFQSCGFQAEGIHIWGNTLTASEYGIFVNLRNAEVAWHVFGNSMDVAQACVFLRNLRRCQLIGNGFGANNPNSTHSDVIIQTDDGADPPVLTNDEAGHIILGNDTFRAVDMNLSLVSPGVATGATTVLSFTTDDPAPAVGDTIWLRSITGSGGVENLNDKPYIVLEYNEDVTPGVSTIRLGEWEINPSEDGTYGSAADVVSAGTWTSGGNFRALNAFLEIRSGSGIIAAHNHYGARTHHALFGLETEDIELLDNQGLATFDNYNVSANPTTIHVRNLIDAPALDEAQTWTLQQTFNVGWKVDGSSQAFGYTAGAGGTVTQITSRTTGVTLNTPTGQITLVSAAGSTSWRVFTVTNSCVAVNSLIVVNQRSGADKYMIHVTNVAAGSFEITCATTGGTTTETPSFSFAVISGATT